MAPAPNNARKSSTPPGGGAQQYNTLLLRFIALVFPRESVDTFPYSGRKRSDAYYLQPAHTGGQDCGSSGRVRATLCNTWPIGTGWPYLFRPELLLETAQWARNNSLRTLCGEVMREVFSANMGTAPFKNNDFAKDGARLE